MTPPRTDACFQSRRYASHDGVLLHYRDYAGPTENALPVVCLTGLTRNARDYEALAAHLSQSYRVICPDFRGRGASGYARDPMAYVPNTYVRDLLTLFDQEPALREAVLIGTSLGGLVATVFAALRPERVAGVVLNDVGPEVDPAGLARIAGYVGKVPAVETWDDAARAVAAIDAFTYPDFTPSDWRRLARQRYAVRDGAVRLDYDPAIARPFSSPETNPDQWPFFRELRTLPTMVLRGAHSDILAAGTVERMREALPALVTAEVPNRGHVPTLDEPEARAAIDRFLAAVPARTPIRQRAARRHAGWFFRREMARAGNPLALLQD
jgi:pimeloyl-ACP methyl ester carboxylesterase